MAEELASRVKQIQRSDPVGKQAWWNYADKQGDGMRDPAKHDAHALEEFLSKYDSGAFAGEQPAEKSGNAGNLGDLFKDGQRNSPAFKMAWSTYNQMNGNFKNDPTKASKDTLVGFLEFLGQQGMMAMTMSGGKGGGWGGKGCGWGGKGDSWGGKGAVVGGGSWASSSKRSSDGPPMKKPKVSTGDVMKDMLVEKVKDFQRSGAEQKQAWWSFCDASENNNRDPAKHDVDVLQSFIDGFAI